MLNEKLQAAINEAATLSPEAQEALLEDPRGDAFVAELFEQARKGPFRPFPTPADTGDEEPEGVG